MNPDLASRLKGVKALAVGQAAIGGALILLSVTALTAVAGHRRGGGKRGATHARTSRRPADSARPAHTGDPFIIGAPELPPDPEPAEHGDEHRGWPGRPGPYALHPDHPSWPGQPDLRWNAEVAALREDDFSSWPGSRRPARREAPYPAAGFAPPPVSADGAAGVIERVRPEASQVRPVVRHVQPENGQVWDAGSVQLATWIISEANQHATEIRHEARDHAAASLAEAKQEAAELMRQAAERAAATLAAAEREAAEARAEVMKLSAHLGGVASYVAENLGSRALPAARSATARPAAGRAANSRAAAAKPASAESASARAAAAKAAAAANPNAVPRQILAGRVMGIIVLAMFMFALLAGTSEVALHGFRFFVFRSIGAGETGPNGLQEDQGPGQPDAPGAHQQLHNP